MKKNDLKNGYIVDLRINGYRRVVLFNELLIDESGGYERASNLIEKYRDDLTHRRDSNLDIVKVYNEDMNLLWERQEVDWSKVPFGTKVRVWDKGEESYEGKFLGYNDKEKCFYPFNVFVDVIYDVAWEKCELVEEEVEIPTYGEIDIEFEQFCRSHKQGCRECEYSWDNCAIEYIFKNYNVSKK